MKKIIFFLLITVAFFTDVKAQSYYAGVSVSTGTVIPGPTITGVNAHVTVTQRINPAVINSTDYPIVLSGLSVFGIAKLVSAVYYWVDPPSFLTPLTINVQSGGYLVVTNNQPSSGSIRVRALLLNHTDAYGSYIRIGPFQTVNVPIPPISITYLDSVDGSNSTNPYNSTLQFGLEAIP
ncbi:hypothetical protein [Chitinophaga nivalis]|uniref:DUF4402 domain-containing protein n=1 Tax=Chitinophaga nivalis TaxID=2991709 RepID=A0ABT3IM19_9BACT|nr:hypothetical protein [Chitinophaga nivalis]MCW3465291.1 hypothetical protein [Chitinophaga nivalis]MCW3485017.1 hypothetical protein [Chitinophaga nivalis]